MTQLELMQLSEPLANVYTQIESDLLTNISSYLAEGNIDIPTSQWKIKKLAQMGKLNKQNAKIIAEQSSQVPELTEIALQNAAASAIQELEPVFKKLVIKGLLIGTNVPIESTIAGALKSFSRQAENQLNLVNTVMQYKAKQSCRKAINKTAELSNKQDFLDNLNKATSKVVTGVEARQSAMRQCINEMCDKGIPAFTDKLGREWSPEAYVNMDIRTTCGNVAHQAQFDRMDDYDIDFIEVSSHAGARPKCAIDQGQIYDRKNKSTKYKHWDNTSYGEPDGILGINCGHFIYPYIPGVSIQRNFPTVNYEENEKLYKLSQKQRQLERSVRNNKRKAACFDKAGDKEGFKKASIRVKESNDKLKDFCHSNGFNYKSNRLYTPEFNRSIAGKANQAYKSHIIDKAKENDIIKLAEKQNNGIIKSEIENGNISLELNHEKQQRHIKGSPNYVEGKSYLTISEAEAEEIIKHQSGKGILVIDRQGIWKKKEKISCDKQIGVNIDSKTKVETPTTRATIHYSKTGTHLVPRKETSNE